MRKRGLNFSVFIGGAMFILAIVCIIRFFVLVGGGG